MNIIRVQELNLDSSALSQFATHLQNNQEAAAMLDAPFMAFVCSSNNAIV